MNGAHKQSIEEQEKAKFSFSGATLYGINAVIGSGIFLLPQKIYSGLGPASLAVMFGVAILVMLYQPVWLKQLATSTKTVEPCNTQKPLSETSLALTLGFSVGPLLLSLGLPC